MTFKAMHISVSIDASPADVYAFAANPKNLPRWAAGLSSGIKQSDGEWIADSPMGRVKVKFAPQNDMGILDHDVTLPNGETMNNPMRVVGNGQGSELSFVLYQRTGISDSEFERDARMVLDDLNRLKTLMEQTP